jgi:hypothetical protein
VDETTYNETNINTTETVDTILNLENQSDWKSNIFSVFL